jgi:Superfamily II DNA/RNA helicases, SNF2 family
MTPAWGKSLQAIRACDEVMALFVLVICPASVVETWKREIAKYRQGDWSAFVTSYERAVGRDFKRIVERKWCVVIIDEAHYLKSLTAKRTQAIYGKNATMPDDCIAARGLQVWALSATPMPNHSAELYPHLRALCPEAIVSPRTGKVWSYYQFEAAYCVVKNTGFGNQIVGTRNDDKLHKKLEGFMLRRRKADVLKELPPLRFADLYLDADVDGIEFEEAEKVRKALAEEGIEGAPDFLRRWCGQTAAADRHGQGEARGAVGEGLARLHATRPEDRPVRPPQGCNRVPVRPAVRGRGARPRGHEAGRAPAVR